MVRRVCRSVVLVAVVVGMLAVPLAGAGTGVEATASADDATAGRAPDEQRRELASQLSGSAEGPVRRAVPGDWLGLVAPGLEVGARVHAAPGFRADGLRGRAGVRVVSEAGGAVEVAGDAESLRRLLSVDGVTAIEILAPVVADVTSEGLGVMGIGQLHEGGLTGQGVKIAIVDLGFDGYTALLGSELPATVTTRSFRDDGLIETGTEHGTAVAEIIHDIAPQAQLYLMVIADKYDYDPAVTYLIDQGVDVANHSAGSIIGPFDDTSVQAGQVNRAAAAGIVWVNSAGNSAGLHWGGNFTDSDGDDSMEFSGSAEMNTFFVPPGSAFQVGITWASSAADYDLCLYDLSGLVDCSMTEQGPGVAPVEYISWVNPTSVDKIYGVVVWRYSGGSYRVDAFFNGIYEGFSGLEFVNPDRSITTPGDASGAVTVGAVDWLAPSVIEPFSSQGPTVDGRAKPDLVAPDFVTTSSYGYEGFPGTSAASPHVAGLAGLYLQHDPSLTPQQLKAALEADALHLGAAGKNPVFGSGLAMAGDLATAPGAFGKVVPADGAVGQPFSPTLTWEASAGATSYEYCYDMSNDGLCGGSWVSTGTTTGASLAGLAVNATYYWQVRASNDFGTTYADGGTWWQFSTGGPTMLEMSFRSEGAYDGWVLESNESSGKGGSIDAAATTGRVGDDASDRQYRSILHFDTSSLPDDAVITAVTLNIKKKKIYGSNPFYHLGWLLVDIKSGFYYYTQELEKYDFQATGSRNNVGRFTKTAPGGWYRAPLRAPCYALVNLTGVTQFRLGFKTDDNDDQVADYLSFYTGNAAEADRPELIITYYRP